MNRRVILELFLKALNFLLLALELRHNTSDSSFVAHDSLLARLQALLCRYNISHASFVRGLHIVLRLLEVGKLLSDRFLLLQSVLHAGFNVSLGLLDFAELDFKRISLANKHITLGFHGLQTRFEFIHLLFVLCGRGFRFLSERLLRLFELGELLRQSSLLAHQSILLARQGFLFFSDALELRLKFGDGFSFLGQLCIRLFDLRFLLRRELLDLSFSLLQPILFSREVGSDFFYALFCGRLCT